MKKGLLLICPKPLCQSDAKWEAIDMKIGFYSHANKTLFHERGFALSLVLKVRVLELRNGLLEFPSQLVWGREAISGALCRIGEHNCR